VKSLSLDDDKHQSIKVLKTTLCKYLRRNKARIGDWKAKTMSPDANVIQVKFLSPDDDNHQSIILKTTLCKSKYDHGLIRIEKKWNSIEKAQRMKPSLK